MTQTKTPLGYIELDNGTKAIMPLNDLFLCHMFQNPENWEVLRVSVNEGFGIFRIGNRS